MDNTILLSELCDANPTEFSRILGPDEFDEESQHVEVLVGVLLLVVVLIANREVPFYVKKTTSFVAFVATTLKCHRFESNIYILLFICKLVRSYE